MSADNQRWLDLLRVCRGDLFTQELITEEEYAWLAARPSKETHSRLDDYHDLRARLAAAEERAQRAEAERAKLSAQLFGAMEACGQLSAERDTARAHVETLKARVLAFCLNKMHRGWHDELKKLLEEGT
jgi:hypothetical protein